MSIEKAKFYWARIGDGNFEPVAVRGKNGSRQAWTIGCPDPFDVDGPDSPVLLEREGDEEDDPECEPMNPPLTPKQENAARRREKRYRAIEISHRYAGFGR